MERKTHYGGGVRWAPSGKTEDEFEDDYDFRTRGRKENLRIRRDERCLKSAGLTDGRANRWQG
jgi:hypothetical protein